MIWVRSIGIAFIVMILSAGRALAAGIDLAVIPFSDDSVPRYAYLRPETPVIRLRFTNPFPDEMRGDGRLSLMAGDETIRTLTYSIDLPANATTDINLPLSLVQCRVAQYRLVARCDVGSNQLTAEAPLWVCPQPALVSPGGGLPMSLWWTHPANDAPTIDNFLQRLHDRGFSAVTVKSSTPLLLDRCLWNQVACVAILEGNAPAAGFKLPADALYRLNADGQPSPTPWQPELGDQPTPGLSNVEWQAAAAHDLGAHVGWLMHYPAFLPRVLTSYDYYQRSGPDYSMGNLHRFRAMYHFGAPRPAEMFLNPCPRILAGPTGVIPDDAPWLLWMRFLSSETLGHFDHLVASEVSATTMGQARIGPISGPMFTPLADPASAQWPPYNFGAAGFSMVASYNFNHYWAPALTQLWWQELGRMNNRQADSWLMLDAMDGRTIYHLQNWYLAMAADVNALTYADDEHISPAAVAALTGLAAQTQRYGKLLVKLEPAPRNVGLLMPFENACYDLNYPVAASYAFDNLMMAHLDAEPVWPEELPNVQANYKVVVLHDIKRLSDANFKRLEDYNHRGGIVVADASTQIAAPWIRTLDFNLADHDRRLSYDDLTRILRVRRALSPLAEPWADTDDPHLLLRHFQAEGIDYLWVVNLMDHNQDAAHQMQNPGDSVPMPGSTANAQTQAAAAEAAPPETPAAADPDAGAEDHTYYGEITVPVVERHHWAFLPWVGEGSANPPGADSEVVDVLAGRRIDTQVKNGRILVPVRMGQWQGTLLAFYPAAPDFIHIKGPHHIDAGKSMDVHVSIYAHHHDAAGLLPLMVEVSDPDGQVSREYSHTALATRGEYKFHIDTAVNDKPGLWKITVTELSTGTSKSITVRVRAGV